MYSDSLRNMLTLHSNDIGSDHVATLSLSLSKINRYHPHVHMSRVRKITKKTEMEPGRDSNQITTET